MAEIAEKLEVIQSAEYGEQVRASIYEALVAINNQVNVSLSSLTDDLTTYQESTSAIVEAAQGAIDDANAAKLVADEAVAKIQGLGDLRISVEFLDPGTAAKASFDQSAGLLYFGIPRPKDGATGSAGKNGTNQYVHIRFSSSSAMPLEVYSQDTSQNTYFSEKPIPAGFAPIAAPAVVNPMAQGYMELRSVYVHTNDETIVKYDEVDEETGQQKQKTYYLPVGGVMTKVAVFTGAPNPNTEGYFEYDSTTRQFTPSTDTEWVSGKTYYQFNDNGGLEQVSEYLGYPNPKALGYYELDENSVRYVTSTDTVPGENDTYYSYEGGVPVAVDVSVANPSALGYYEYDSVGRNYVRTMDTTVAENKTYYRETGSEWIGFEVSNYPTASTNSTAYTWVKFRGPKGETGAGVPDMTANLEALDGRKVGTTENLYPVASVGRFNGQSMTADKYKGYDAVLVWLQYLTQETFWITTTVGKLSKKTGSKMVTITDPDSKKGKKDPRAQQSKAFNYTAFSGDTTTVAFYNERIPILVPAGNQWISVSHVSNTGEVSSRRIRYDAVNGTVEFSAATVGTVYNSNHGSYCYDNHKKTMSLSNYQYKKKVSKTGKVSTVTIKSPPSYSYDQQYDHRAHSNMWLVPVAIHGVKNLGRDLPLTAP